MFNYSKTVRIVSPWWYYIISFVSFAVAVKIMPWTTEMVTKYVPASYEYANPVAALVATWLIAFFILPEIGCIIYAKSIASGN